MRTCCRPTAASPSSRRPAGSSAGGSTAGCTGRAPRSRRTGWPPSGRCCTRCPAEPYALALGEERLVGDDQTVRFGSVRYSTPPGHAGTRVWCRVAGTELVITARTGRGAAEITRHRLSVPGSPSDPGRALPAPSRAGTGRASPGQGRGPQAEAAFLAIGDGAQRWLAEAAASGAARIRSKMARAVELAAVVGAGKVDAALGLAAIAGRFADGDLASIIDHLAAERAPGEVVIADQAHSAQPGTSGWARLGTEGAGR